MEQPYALETVSFDLYYQSINKRQWFTIQFVWVSAVHDTKNKIKHKSYALFKMQFYIHLYLVMDKRMFWPYFKSISKSNAIVSWKHIKCKNFPYVVYEVADSYYHENWSLVVADKRN